MIRFIRDALLHDIWLKLFSLALAVLTWVTVSYAIQRKQVPTANLSLTADQLTFHKVPVVVLSAAQDSRGFKVFPPDVDVTVQGDARTLRRLQTSDIRALVDLTGVDGATDLWKRIEVATPAGVTYVRVYPQDAHIIFP
jgi:YbbR domain-containing protein